MASERRGTMVEPIRFTVRPLARGIGLEGAFRVHITSKELDALGLKSGELCHLCTAEGNTGTGIACRSDEPPTKHASHPIKLTDAFRDAFNIKLGNIVTVTKATTQIRHADHVVITDVSDTNSLDQTRDDTNWQWRCGNILGSIEAIANGIPFEASSRKGLRKRFLIESINNRSRDSSAIYFFDDQSELIVQDGSTTLVSPNYMKQVNFDNAGIGGLCKQIDHINRRIDRMIGEVNGRPIPANFRRNDGILLYGPHGTGKTLLLKNLAKAPWRKVVHINRSMLPGTTARNQGAVSNIVTVALAHQPSLIIMDSLHLIAAPDDDTGMVDILIRELDRLAGTRVLIVAATTHPSDIDSSLRCPGRFEYEFEIPIPDTKARVEILKAIHTSPTTGGHTPRTTTDFDALADDIAPKTHGFVGRDLSALYRLAQDHAIDRQIDQGDWVTVDKIQSDSESQISTLINGNQPHSPTTPSHASRPSVSSIYTYAPQPSKEIAHIELSLADFEHALLDVRPTAMKEVFLETPKVPWSQIGGSDAVKSMMDEVIEWPLKRASDMLDLGMPAEKGILLYGPPGCSKTLTAKAVATSSGLNFIAVKGAELTSMYVGESERSVREVFRKARAAAPSILFFDEIDSIASERDSHSTKGLNMLTTLLNEMDGIESLNGVLVLAATNKPEVLDSALLRPGRFDTLVYIGPPDEAARLEIFKIRTTNVPLNSDVDLDVLAAQTEGFSGAEVVNICTEAAKETLRRRVALDHAGSFDDYSERSMSAADFQGALKRAVRRISPDMVKGYISWRDRLKL